MKRRTFLAGAASFAAIPAAAQQQSIIDPQALSGDRFTAGGEEFQLADIIAPPLYTLQEEKPAYFEESRQALSQVLSGGVVIEGAGPTSRWGVRLVNAFAGDGRQSVQEILCGAGAARVLPQTDDHELIDRLLAVEKDAREAGKGLWGLSAYRIFAAHAARDAIGAFHLVEGVIERAAKTRGRVYLNFGADYRTDFTAGATNRIYRRWAKDGFDLAELEGARVRIRGFVESINGPSMDLTHPRQIERLAL